MSREYYKPGSWWVYCDRCQFKRRAEDTIETWNHLIVCHPKVKPGCYETRHPQTFVKAVPDNQQVEFIRPRGDIDAQGQPIVSQSPAVNCNCYENRIYSPVFGASEKIFKGRVKGPMIVTSGTITVVCSLEIY